MKTIIKWQSNIAKAKQFGFINILKCLITRLWYQQLNRKFRFDPWHSKNNWYCRSYKRTAVGMINNLHPKIVVEVGCGLGEIISRVEAPYRVGYDIEPTVIDAARYLHGTNVNFEYGTGVDVKETHIDVLIVLNWIHNLSADKIEDFLKPFYKRVNYFLLEGINEGEKNYKYHHKFTFLEGHAKLINAIDGGIGEARKLMLFESIKR
jgi:2-polyprenyl-3-methyl-5-hydroxy-6-metoxy-1,4-benzoquinol methylase